MQLSDVRDWLRTVFPEAARAYVGRIDAAQERCIGIYDGQARPAVRALGPQSYDVLPVSILVYWTADARETQAAAQTLYDRLRAVRRPVIGGHEVPLIALTSTAPVDCTRPESPVYEQVIEAVIYYNKEA